jgi:hypothetical protein
MPRATTSSGEFKKVKLPTGVLECNIIDLVWIPRDNLEQHFKGWQLEKYGSSDLAGILQLHVMPKGHTKYLKHDIEVSFVFDKEDQIDFSKSKGLRTINYLLGDLGLKVAGFNTQGQFCSESDKIIADSDDMEPAIDLIARALFARPDFRIIMVVYMSQDEEWYRLSKYHYQDSEKGRAAAEEQAVKMLSIFPWMKDGVHIELSKKDDKPNNPDKPKKQKSSSPKFDQF